MGRPDSTRHRHQPPKKTARELTARSRRRGRGAAIIRDSSAIGHRPRIGIDTALDLVVEAQQFLDRGHGESPHEQAVAPTRHREGRRPGKVPRAAGLR